MKLGRRWPALAECGQGGVFFFFLRGCTQVRNLGFSASLQVQSFGKMMILSPAIRKKLRRPGSKGEAGPMVARGKPFFGPGLKWPCVHAMKGWWNEERHLKKFQLISESAIYELVGGSESQSACK